MDFTTQDSLVLLVLLATAAGLLAIAPWVGVPYPILLVVGGLVIGFVPGMPTVELPPDLVLVALLPPLLYSAAFFTSLRDLRANVEAIGLLSVGLVLLTMTTVAVVGNVVVGLPWAAAFALGAVVSPTDPVAATAILQRLGIPRRVVAIVEGESLINDGTALVAYRVAVTAVIAGTFSPGRAAVDFVVTAVGGIAVGLAVGFVVRHVRRRLDNPPAELAISLMTAYFAYLPAEALGVSAVLAAVTVGIYLGWHAPELTTAQVRLQGEALWGILVFVLNALLFLLVGLQLPSVLDALGDIPADTLAWYAIAVSGVVILTRIAFVFPASFLPGIAGGRPDLRVPAVISWTGMRGAVSLAAALALPLTTDAGTAFPGRDLIVFLTFSVIVATLVLQGLTLPLLIRALGFDEDALDGREEAKARIHAAEAALARLEALAGEDWVNDDTAERMRGAYRFRRTRFEARFDEEDDGAIEERSASYQRLRRELLMAERDAVVQLRRAGRINDDVMRRVERDLDLEDSRLDI